MKKTREDRINMIRGNAIIEYTIVFPLVLLVIFALFYAGFIMHQRSVIDSAVNRGTIYAARLIADPQYQTVVSAAGTGDDSLDCANNNYNFSSAFDIQPYRYILNFNGDTAKAKTEDMVKAIIKNNSFWGGSDSVSVDYKYKNYVLYQVIEITAEQEFPLPGILKLVGVEDKLTINAAAVQAVTDPDEFIRNVDLVLDMVKQITGKDVAKGIQSFTSKIATFAGKLFGTK